MGCPVDISYGRKSDQVRSSAATSGAVDPEVESGKQQSLSSGKADAALRDRGRNCVSVIGPRRVVKSIVDGGPGVNSSRKYLPCDRMHAHVEAFN